MITKPEAVSPPKQFRKLPLNENGQLVDNEYDIDSPENLIIVSFPKMGKSFNMVNEPNILIGDAERGTQYFKARNVVSLTDYHGERAFVKVKSGAFIPAGIFETVDELRHANRMDEYWSLRRRLESAIGTERKAIYEDTIAHLHSMKFPIFVIDTITSIQALNNEAALEEYNTNSVKDPSKRKTDIRRVDDYGGVQYIRRNFNGLKSFIENNAAPFIIWNGHVGMKKKILKKGTEEVSAVDIALDGLLPQVFTAKASAAAVFYRNDEGCFLDFTKKDESDLGSRPQHLANKVIKIADLNEVDKEGNVLKKGKTYWSRVYPELKWD